MYFEDTIDDVKYCGHLYGLGTSFFQNGIPYESYITPQSLVAVAQSVAAQAHSHNSASQSSLSSLANSANNQNSASTPNLTSIPSLNSLNGANDPSKNITNKKILIYSI